MLKTRMNNTMAKVSINNQIDEGEKLLAKFDDIGLINSHTEFLEAQRDEVEWSLLNEFRLREIFDNKSASLLTNEYARIEIGDINDNQSLSENKKILRENIERKVHWLGDLVDRQFGK